MNEIVSLLHCYIVMKPLISVIIPVFNHAHCLERCLHSLSRQSYRPLEVIVINDGSTDNFAEVMNDLVKKDWKKDFSLKIFNQKNQGGGGARNHGFSESVGQYVIFWDADTIAAPEMLGKMHSALESHPEVSYAYSQYRFGWKKMRSQPFNADDLRKNNFVDTTSLIRRGAAVPFDESLKRFQDWDLWLSMLEKGRVGIFIPEVLFRKIVVGRIGYSKWLPSLMYRLPWKTRAVRDYESARQIVLRKHSNSAQAGTPGR